MEGVDSFRECDCIGIGWNEHVELPLFIIRYKELGIYKNILGSHMSELGNLITMI